MVTDLILVSVLKDTGFVTMGKHVNVSYYSATQIFVTYLEEICKVGFDCLNIAVQCNFKCSRIPKVHSFPFGVIFARSMSVSWVF